MNILGNLKLERPICFYDLEATHLEISKSRIISIGTLKIYPDGSSESKYKLINPTIPIPPESTAIHNISDEDVKDSPTFKNVAKAMHEFFEGCDIGGYNNNSYDNQLLQEEFFKCGFDFPNPERVLSIDACTIFKKFEKRDLASALKFFCGKEMENAHNAEADNNATVEIFSGQLNKYSELQGKTVKELSDFCKQDNRVDWAGRIIRNENGEYIYNFGTAKGTKVKENVGFGNWVFGKDFPETFKELIRKILAE